MGLVSTFFGLLVWPLRFMVGHLLRPRVYIIAALVVLAVVAYFRTVTNEMQARWVVQLLTKLMRTLEMKGYRVKMKSLRIIGLKIENFELMMASSKDNPAVSISWSVLEVSTSWTNIKAIVSSALSILGSSTASSDKSSFTDEASRPENNSNNDGSSRNSSSSETDMNEWRRRIVYTLTIVDFEVNASDFEFSQVLDPTPKTAESLSLAATAVRRDHFVVTDEGFTKPEVCLRRIFTVLKSKNMKKLVPCLMQHAASIFACDINSFVFSCVMQTHEAVIQGSFDKMSMHVEPEKSKFSDGVSCLLDIWGYEIAIDSGGGADEQLKDSPVKRGPKLKVKATPVKLTAGGVSPLQPPLSSSSSSSVDQPRRVVVEGKDLTIGKCLRMCGQRLSMGADLDLPSGSQVAAMHIRGSCETSLWVQPFLNFYENFQVADDHALEVKIARGLETAGKMVGMGVTAETINLTVFDERCDNFMVIDLSDINFDQKTFRLATRETLGVDPPQASKVEVKSKEETLYQNAIPNEQSDRSDLNRGDEERFRVIAGVDQVAIFNSNVISSSSSSSSATSSTSSLDQATRYVLSNDSDKTMEVKVGKVRFCGYDGEFSTASVSGVTMSKSLRVLNSGGYVDDEMMKVAVKDVDLQRVDPLLLNWLVVLQELSNELPSSRFAHFKNASMEVNISSITFSSSPDMSLPTANNANSSPNIPNIPNSISTSKSIRAQNLASSSSVNVIDIETSDKLVVVECHMMAIKQRKAFNKEPIMDLHADSLLIHSTVLDTDFVKELNVSVLKKNKNQILRVGTLWSISELCVSMTLGANVELISLTSSEFSIDFTTNENLLLSSIATYANRDEAGDRGDEMGEEGRKRLRGSKFNKMSNEERMEILRQSIPNVSPSCPFADYKNSLDSSIDKYEDADRDNDVSSSSSTSSILQLPSLSPKKKSTSSSSTSKSIFSQKHPHRIIDKSALNTIKTSSNLVNFLKITCNKSKNKSNFNHSTTPITSTPDLRHRGLSISRTSDDSNNPDLTVHIGHCQVLTSFGDVLKFIITNNSITEQRTCILNLLTSIKMHPSSLAAQKALAEGKKDPNVAIKKKASPKIRIVGDIICHMILEKTHLLGDAGAAAAAADRSMSMFTSFPPRSGVDYDDDDDEEEEKDFLNSRAAAAHTGVCHMTFHAAGLRVDLGDDNSGNNNSMKKFKEGDLVEFNYCGLGTWYSGKIEKVRDDATYDIKHRHSRPLSSATATSRRKEFSPSYSSSSSSKRQNKDKEKGVKMEVKMERDKDRDDYSDFTEMKVSAELIQFASMVVEIDRFRLLTGINIPFIDNSLVLNRPLFDDDDDDDYVSKSAAAATSTSTIIDIHKLAYKSVENTRDRRSDVSVDMTTFDVNMYQNANFGVVLQKFLTQMNAYKAANKVNKKDSETADLRRKMETYDGVSPESSSGLGGGGGGSIGGLDANFDMINDDSVSYQVRERVPSDIDMWAAVDDQSTPKKKVASSSYSSSKKGLDSSDLKYNLKPCTTIPPTYSPTIPPPPPSTATSSTRPGKLGNILKVSIDSTRVLAFGENEEIVCGIVFSKTKLELDATKDEEAMYTEISDLLDRTPLDGKDGPDSLDPVNLVLHSDAMGGYVRSLSIEELLWMLPGDRSSRFYNSSSSSSSFQPGYRENEWDLLKKSMIKVEKVACKGPLYMTSVSNPSILIKDMDTSLACVYDDYDGVEFISTLHQSSAPVKMYFALDACIDGGKVGLDGGSLKSISDFLTVLFKFLPPSDEKSPPLDIWDNLRYNLHGSFSLFIKAIECRYKIEPVRNSYKSQTSIDEMAFILSISDVNVGINSSVLAVEAESINLDSSFKFARLAQRSKGSVRKRQTNNMNVSDDNDRQPSGMPSNRARGSSFHLTPDSVNRILTIPRLKISLDHSLESLTDYYSHHDVYVRPVSLTNIPYDRFVNFRTKRKTINWNLDVSAFGNRKVKKVKNKKTTTPAAAANGESSSVDGVEVWEGSDSIVFYFNLETLENYVIITEIINNAAEVHTSHANSSHKTSPGVDGVGGVGGGSAGSSPTVSESSVSIGGGDSRSSSPNSHLLLDGNPSSDVIYGGNSKLSRDERPMYTGGAGGGAGGGKNDRISESTDYTRTRSSTTENNYDFSSPKFPNGSANGIATPPSPSLTTTSHANNSDHPSITDILNRVNLVCKLCPLLAFTWSKKGRQQIGLAYSQEASEIELACVNRKAMEIDHLYVHIDKSSLCARDWLKENDDVGTSYSGDDEGADSNSKKKMASSVGGRAGAESEESLKSVLAPEVVRNKMVDICRVFYATSIKVTRQNDSQRDAKKDDYLHIERSSKFNHFRSFYESSRYDNKSFAERISVLMIDSASSITSSSSSSLRKHKAAKNPTRMGLHDPDDVVVVTNDTNTNTNTSDSTISSSGFNTSSSYSFNTSSSTKKGSLKTPIKKLDSNFSSSGGSGNRPPLDKENKIWGLQVQDFKLLWTNDILYYIFSYYYEYDSPKYKVKATAKVAQAETVSPMYRSDSILTPTPGMDDVSPDTTSQSPGLESITPPERARSHISTRPKAPRRRSFHNQISQRSMSEIDDPLIEVDEEFHRFVVVEFVNPQVNILDSKSHSSLILMLAKSRLEWKIARSAKYWEEEASFIDKQLRKENIFFLDMEGVSMYSVPAIGFDSQSNKFIEYVHWVSSNNSSFSGPRVFLPQKDSQFLKIVTQKVHITAEYKYFSRVDATDDLLLNAEAIEKEKTICASILDIKSLDCELDQFQYLIFNNVIKNVLLQPPPKKPQQQTVLVEEHRKYQLMMSRLKPEHMPILPKLININSADKTEKDRTIKDIKSNLETEFESLLRSISDDVDSARTMIVSIGDGKFTLRNNNDPRHMKMDEELVRLLGGLEKRLHGDIIVGDVIEFESDYTLYQGKVVNKAHHELDSHQQINKHMKWTISDIVEIKTARDNYRSYDLPNGLIRKRSFPLMDNRSSYMEKDKDKDKDKERGSIGGASDEGLDEKFKEVFPAEDEVEVHYNGMWYPGYISKEYLTYSLSATNTNTNGSSRPSSASRLSSTKLTTSVSSENLQVSSDNPDIFPTTRDSIVGNVGIASFGLSPTPATTLTIEFVDVGETNKMSNKEFAHKPFRGRVTKTEVQRSSPGSRDSTCFTVCDVTDRELNNVFMINSINELDSPEIVASNGCIRKTVFESKKDEFGLYLKAGETIDVCYEGRWYPGKVTYMRQDPDDKSFSIVFIGEREPFTLASKKVKGIFENNPNTRLKFNPEQIKPIQPPNTAFFPVAGGGRGVGSMKSSTTPRDRPSPAITNTNSNTNANQPAQGGAYDESTGGATAAASPASFTEVNRHLQSTNIMSSLGFKWYQGAISEMSLRRIFGCSYIARKRARQLKVDSRKVVKKLSYRENDNVEVKLKGTWHPAKIVAIRQVDELLMTSYDVQYYMNPTVDETAKKKWKFFSRFNTSSSSKSTGAGGAGVNDKGGNSDSTNNNIFNAIHKADNVSETLIRKRDETIEIGFTEIEANLQFKPNRNTSIEVKIQRSWMKFLEGNASFEVISQWGRENSECIVMPTRSKRERCAICKLEYDIDNNPYNSCRHHGEGVLIDGNNKIYDKNSIENELSLKDEKERKKETSNPLLKDHLKWSCCGRFESDPGCKLGSDKDSRGRHSMGDHMLIITIEMFPTTRLGDNDDFVDLNLVKAMKLQIFPESYRINKEGSISYSLKVQITEDIYTSLLNFLHIDASGDVSDVAPANPNGHSNGKDDSQKKDSGILDAENNKLVTSSSADRAAIRDEASKHNDMEISDKNVREGVCINYIGVGQLSLFLNCKYNYGLYPINLENKQIYYAPYNNEHSWSLGKGYFEALQPVISNLIANVLTAFFASKGAASSANASTVHFQTLSDFDLRRQLGYIKKERRVERGGGGMGKSGKDRGGDSDDEEGL